jgi:hypothetical protein
MRRLLLFCLFALLLVSVVSAQKVPMVKEEFQCIFQGALTEETCTSARGHTCTGVRACSITVKAPYGDHLKWKSTCDDETMFVVTGLHQRKNQGAFIPFRCKMPNKTPCNFDKVCQDEESSSCFDCKAGVNEPCNYNLQCDYGETEIFCQDCRDVSHVYDGVPPPLVEVFEEPEVVEEEMPAEVLLPEPEVFEEPEEAVPEVVLEPELFEEPEVILKEIPETAEELEVVEDEIPEVVGRTNFNRFIVWLKGLFS